MTTSKSVGGVSGEDPSATVSRPESPTLYNHSDYRATSFVKDNDEDEANETTALSSVSHLATVGTGSGYFQSTENAFHSSNDLNRPPVRPGAFETFAAKCAEFNRSKPDLIPCWEQTLASTQIGGHHSVDFSPASPTYITYGASRYRTYRRPSLTASNRGILSPVQKVLSDNESSSNGVSTSSGRESPSKLVTFSSSPRKFIPKNERDFDAHLNYPSRTLPQKCFTADELSSFRGSNLNDRSVSRDSVI